MSYLQQKITKLLDRAVGWKVDFSFIWQVSIAHHLDYVRDHAAPA